MENTSLLESAAAVVSPDKIYEEIRAGIRDTDSISFKLLGLVPLVSGAALISLVLQTRELPSGLVVLLALFASTITLGLFRWELRNVQTCSWLLDCARALEAEALKNSGTSQVFQSRPPRPQRIGKTEAEKLIYAATILAWLALPVGLGAVREQQAYFSIAGVVLVATIISLFASPRGFHPTCPHGSQTSARQEP